MCDDRKEGVPQHLQARPWGASGLGIVQVQKPQNQTETKVNPGKNAGIQSAELLNF